MKRLCYLFILFTLIIPYVQAGEPARKKVAVVLSGGGAKGMAHIGALKVIERAGIPIDYIVGTSMGSIIGGLYAIGYTPEQMDSLVTRQDWPFLLTDAVDRKEELLVKKQNSEKYTLSVPFDNTPKDALRGGVVAGRNIAHLFSELTEGYHDSIDFRTLPIPFACVATNIVDGSEYVFRSGKLALAMRASMSIPGVFAPVHWNGMVLIDGGMVNNYPVDVAKQMGADIIIGVDVQDNLASADKLKSVSEVLGQIINIICSNKYEHNAEDSDVLIKVNVKGYSAGSFNKPAIDSLKVRGYQAAELQWDNLVALKEKIGIAPDYIPKRHGPFLAQSRQVEVVPEINPGTVPENSISVGAHFDNESLAALMLNTYIGLNKKQTHQASLTLRLGRQMFGNIGYTIRPFNPAWSLSLNYQLGYNDIDLYHNGSKTCTYTYVHNLGQINISRSWRNILLSLGTRYEYFNYSDLLLPFGYEGDMVLENQHLVTYYGQMQFDSYDRRTYPRKGMKWELAAKFYTDNGLKYNDERMQLALSAYWEGVFRITNRFSLLPWIGGRALLTEDYGFAFANFVGGNAPGRLEPQQLPFVGIDYMQLAGAKTFVGGLRLRQRMGANHYAIGTFNVGVNHDRWNQLFDNFMWGGGATYGYDTFLGPLEVTVSYSNVTKKIGSYVSLGYNF